MKDIKDFRIGIANYLLENDKGSKLKLTLNYKDNSFSVKVITGKGNLHRLEKEAGIIARDMLSRKAQKNLSYKLLNLEN